MARDQEARTPVARRTYLKLAATGAFGVAATAAGSGGTVAAMSTGYGAGGYGTVAYGGSEETDTDPSASAADPRNVGRTEATLAGAVSSFGGASSATVRFEYRATNASGWTATPEQSLSETGSFSESITGLEPATEYEFRVSVTASDGDTARSSSRTFETDRHSLVIDGSPSPDAFNEYSFSVSDSVEKSANLGSIQDSDTISGRSVSGKVLGGRDGYRFTGDVTEFEIDGDATVSIDGEVVEPAELGNTTYPNAITFDGSPAPRQLATYETTVSGKLTKSSVLGSINSYDTIEGSSASGRVVGGKDGYRFTGEVTELVVDGAMTISLTRDGDATGDTLSNTLVVDGTGSPDRVVTYSISVAGSAEKSSSLGSINARDRIENGVISGRVIGGKDGYRYSGNVTQIEIEGPAVLRFGTTN